MKQPKIELRSATIENIKEFKKVNFAVFPIAYDNKFYNSIPKLGELAKLAYYNDRLAGAMCCRIDTSNSTRRIYIMTFGIFCQFRRNKVGTTMIEHILNYAAKDNQIESIFLHVQVSNKEATEFYKNFGFEVAEVKKNYYRRIKPADACILQKKLKP